MLKKTEKSNLSRMIREKPLETEELSVNAPEYLHVIHITHSFP